MLSKGQLIEAIRKINRSAGVDWLQRFDEHALQRYFDHLQLTLQPRGSRWIRHPETPAVVTGGRID